MTPLTLRRRQTVPSLRSIAAGGRQRDNVQLFLLHGPSCPGCARIAAELAAHRQELEAWGGEVLVLHEEETAFADLPFRQERDPGGRTRRAFGGADADAVIACLDFRGLLMDGWALRHPEPVDWHEVAETARWVAVQEPECGTCVIAPGWDEE
ncbi:MAG TPA: hypothetical protein VFB21_07465 [Chthonomonadaceae bacterium]|nr:hypothetical protein [Chthonomonadaceae bacterium]